MSFISFEYVIFFSLVVGLFFILPSRRRWLLLLIASYIFYAASRLEYVLLIAFSTLVDYFVGRRIGQLPQDRTRSRRLLLALSLTVNLGVLFIFKYFNFFGESAGLFFTSIGLDTDFTAHNLILPVGISFYTFQSMAYTIDVYRGKVDVEHNAGIFATYVAFFPQLVAGPIERAQNMLPQFRKTHQFDYDRVVSGLRLVLWGAFKKIVIADTLAIYVNNVYNETQYYSGLTFWLATLFFTFQIYCDFSGYSDIAIGSARVMGFKLMDNFRQPYLSRSIREFWRRWHISLSTWFRDYLYIPLGGSRVSLLRTVLNLMIVFVVSGLWHGANWTFVLWGALHGLFIVVEVLYSHWQGRPKLPGNVVVHWIQRLLTFGLVVFAWIFFRANNIDDAFHIVGQLFNFEAGTGDILRPFMFMNQPPEFYLQSSLMLIGGLMVIEYLNSQWHIHQWAMRFWFVRWILYYIAGGIILFSLVDTVTIEQFIYFQF